MKLLPILKSMITNEKAYLNQYCFENGTKTIYFQEMIHVGSERLYSEINQSIKNFLEENKRGKVYLEGIHGQEKDGQQFNDKIMKIFGLKKPKNIDGMFFKELYKQLSYLAGLSAQHPENYLKDIPEKKIVKADMDYLQMLEHMENIPLPKKEIDVSFDQESWDKLKKLKFPGWLLKNFLRSMTIHKDSLRIGEKSPSQAAFQNLILHKRNIFLLNILEQTKDKKIFVTYGAAHTKEIKQELLKLGYTCSIVKKIEF